MSLSQTTQPYTDGQPRASQANREHPPKIDRGDLMRRAEQVCCRLPKVQGAYSSIVMSTAGFYFVGTGDAVRCGTCGLEVSGWTSDMKPLAIHSQRSPTCAFVRSTQPEDSSIHLSSTPFSPISTLHLNDRVCRLVEVNALKQTRRETFKRWPHQSSPTDKQMIRAGFFTCMVADRVVCIYCNLICQHWTPQTDDPSHVHKTLAPQCPFVLSALSNELPSPHHPSYAEASRRHDSFTTWRTENLTLVDALVNSGFFYAGNNNVVTCFHCNGSLENWYPGVNLMVEHARLYPQCEYAQQLCGSGMHTVVSQSKQANRREGIGASDFSKLVADRIALPISRCVLESGFSQPIVERCWEDRLRLQDGDFVDSCQLFMACKILERQIQCIAGKRENIVVPHEEMKKIRDGRPTALRSEEQAQRQSLSSISRNEDSDRRTSTSASSLPQFLDSIEASSTGNTRHHDATNALLLSYCGICREALIPCRHLRP